MSTSSENEIVQEPLDGKELFAIEGSEKWRSTPGEPEEREKRPKGRKTPSNRLAAINTAIQLVGIMSRFPVRTAQLPMNLHVENMKFFQKLVD